MPVSSGLSSFLCFRPADHGIGDKTTVRIKDVTMECTAADLQHRRYLGHGAYGLVEEMVHLPSNIAMAVKVRCSTVSWRQRVGYYVRCRTVSWRQRVGYYVRCSTVSWRQSWLLCKVQHCLLATESWLLCKGQHCLLATESWLLCKVQHCLSATQRWLLRTVQLQ